MKYSLFLKDKSFYQTVMRMALPIALQNLITIGINVADTMMLSMIGETAMAASSLAAQYINIFQVFCMGLSMGASVLAARFWGSGDLDSLRKTVTIMLRICLALATVFTLITALAPTAVTRLYTEDVSLITEGVKYLNYSVLTFYFQGISWVCTIVLRSVRKVRLPLVVSVISFVVNIVGNYVFMFGKLGFPAMGVAGAALSTLCVRIVEFVVIVGYFICVEQDIGFRPRHLFLKTRDLLGEYIRISLPVLCSDGIGTLGSTGMTMIIGRMGVVYTSANAIVSVWDRMMSVFYSGVSQTSSVFVGNAMGEGKNEKAREQGYAFIGIGVLLGILSSVIALCLPAVVIPLYHLTGDSAAVTRQMLYVSAFVLLWQGPVHIMTKGVLRGGGDTRILMIMDNVFQWCPAILLGALTGLVFHCPAWLVYLCLKSETFPKAFWAAKRMISGKWMKKIRTAQNPDS
ncbi:MAG: MATE family efflux transporter [Lachnospiraceae bacterium]|nr:MATE family efflux transporter [Lachnospiraceae bacterium]